MNSPLTQIVMPRPSVATFLLLAATFGLASPARCEVPALTAENGPRLIGKTATLKMTVASLKKSERRQLHFLGSTPNFRGRANQTVAIRADDLKHFRRAGIDDLEASYRNRRIRARGKVVQNEGQILLFVSGPEQIEVLDATPPAPPPASDQRAVVVVDPRGKTTTFPLPLDDALPRKSLRVEHDGVLETYSGVTLATLLTRVGITMGHQARGRQLARYIVLSADDDYAVVLSVAEVDPFLSDQTVLLAEKIDGRPIAAIDRPSLVVSGDKHHRRWIRQVSRIEVRSALAGANGGKRASKESTPHDAPPAE